MVRSNIKIYRQKSEGRREPAMQAAWRACFFRVYRAAIRFIQYSRSCFCKSSLRRISGITNRKQTCMKTVDIVHPVSSSLLIRMDLTRQTPVSSGFFSPVIARYPPIDLISIKLRISIEIKRLLNNQTAYPQSCPPKLCTKYRPRLELPGQASWCSLDRR